MEKEKMKHEKAETIDFVRPDGGYGWVVVFALILMNSTLLTLVQCFGIIFKDEFSIMGITAAETSFLLHLHSSMYCVIGFFGSPLLKRYEFRSVAFVGASLMSLGIFLTSFAESYMVLILTISILIGFGQGILMPATYLATNSYFKKRLTIAVSISATGASLSSVFMPKICDVLLTRVGRKYTVLILFAISLTALLCSFLLRPVQKNKDDNKLENLLRLNDAKEAAKEVEEANDKLIRPTSVYKETTVPAKAEAGMLQKLYDLFDLQLLKQLSYVLVVIGLGVSFAAELNMVLMMQFILPELSNFTREDVANVTSLQFVFDIIGRLIVPLFSHYCNAPSKWMYAGALIAATSARTVLALWGQSYYVVYICCSLIGITKGTRAVFQSVIIPKLVPLEKIPAANGINMLFTGAVSLMIGPIIGAIHDGAHSYVPALHAASALSMACVVLWALEGLLIKINK